MSVWQGTGCMEGVPYSIEGKPKRILAFFAHGGMDISFFSEADSTFNLPRGVDYINLGKVDRQCWFLINEDFNILSDFIWNNQDKLFLPGPEGQPNKSNIPSPDFRHFIRGEGVIFTAFKHQSPSDESERLHPVTNHYCLGQVCNNYSLTFHDDNPKLNLQLGWKEINGTYYPTNKNGIVEFNDFETLDYGTTSGQETEKARQKMADIKYLYRSGYDIKISDIVEAFEGTNTLILFHSCRTLQYDDDGVVRNLSDKSPPPQIKDINNKIYDAIESGSVRDLKRWISPLNVNQPLDNNSTPLSIAVKYGTPEIIDFLLSQGANLNYKDEQGNTIIHDATKNPNPEVLKLLIDARTNIDTLNHYWESPIFTAEKHKNIPAVKQLLQNGAEINRRSLKKETPLSIVKRSRVFQTHSQLENQKELIKLLKENGAEESNPKKQTKKKKGGKKKTRKKKKKRN